MIRGDLQTLLTRFALGSIPAAEARERIGGFTAADVDDLIEAVRSMGDPSDFMGDLDQRENQAQRDDDPILSKPEDRQIVEGFFLFIDFVAAALLRLGPSAVARLEARGDRHHPHLQALHGIATNPRLQADARRFLGQD